MPRVLLLLPTTTYRTQAFMDAASRLGVEVTVASEEPSSVTALNPTGLLTLDFTDPLQAARQAVEFAARHPIDAVVPVDDQVTVVGAAICQALGLASNSVESAGAARSKFLMRELLARAGVSQPRYRLCSLEDDPLRLSRQAAYPCVVKPLSLAASRGVIRANDETEFVQAVGRLSAILQQESRSGAGSSSIRNPSRHAGTIRNSSTTHHSPLITQKSEVRDQRSEASNQRSAISNQQSAISNHSPLTHYLVEEYIPGHEVALEGLLGHGRLRVLALFDKPDPLEGPFFEETIYVTPSRLPESDQERIAQCTVQACQALGLTEGPVHAELRLTTHPSPLTTHQPYIIEINPRSIGGLCSRVLRFGTGLSLEELIIRHALDVDFVPPSRERQAAGVMMIPIPRAGVLAEVRGLAEARTVPGIEQVTISARLGQELVPLPEGSLYLGFIFARGRTPELVEAALRQSHTQLRFDIH